MTYSTPTIKANGADIPTIGLGTWQSTEEEGVKAVETALACGYRHIDTAARYENEAAVGRGLRNSGLKRDEYFVTTKVWWTDLSSSAFDKAARASLDRLQLDQVDLLLVHWPNPEIPLEETIGALCEAKKRGLTRHIGVSNFTPSLIDQAVAVASEPLVANQCEYHPYLDQTLVLNACKRHGMAFISYSPLGSGKLLEDPIIAKIASEYGKTPAQIILRWEVQQEGVAAVPKSANPVRIAQNLDIFDFVLSDTHFAQISALARADGRVISPAFAPAWNT